MKRGMAIGCLLTALFGFAASGAAQEPSWYGVIFARGELRQQIESTPILERPNRPLHFYGNTVRREYYRGNPLPMPRDLVRGTTAFAVRR